MRSKIDKYSKQLKKVEGKIAEFIEERGEQPDESVKRERLGLIDKSKKYVKMLPRLEKKTR